MDRPTFVRPDLPDPLLDLDATPTLDDLLALARQYPDQVKVTETQGVGRNRGTTYYRFRIEGAVKYQGRLYGWASTAKPTSRDKDHISWSVSRVHPAQIALDLYEEHAHIATTRPGLTAVIDRLFDRLCEHLSPPNLGGNRPQKMWLNLYDILAKTGQQHLYGSSFTIAMNEAFGLQEWSDLGDIAVRIDEPGPFCTTLEQWLELPGHKVQRTGSDMRYTGAHTPHKTLWAGTTSKYKVIASQHYAEVQRCLIERRPITADVLNEYPDLAMQANEDGLTHPPVDDDYRPVWMRTRDEFCVSHPMSAGSVPVGRVGQAKERYHEIAVQDAVERRYPVPSRVREHYGIESEPKQLGTSPQSDYTQWQQIKAQYPDVIVLIPRKGGYEAYEADAATVELVYGTSQSVRLFGTDRRVPAVVIPADRVEDVIGDLVKANYKVARVDRIEPETEMPSEPSEQADPEPISVTPAMFYDAWETYLGRADEDLTDTVLDNYSRRAMEMFLTGKHRNTEVAERFRRFCRVYLHGQVYGWGEPFAHVKIAFDAGADYPLHAPLDIWRPTLGPEWLTPIPEWDIGWETAGPFGRDTAVVCSRCRNTPRSDEKWYRGWMGDSPANARDVYLCPACQGELHRWSERQLQTRLAEREERKCRIRTERMLKMVELQALREQRRERDNPAQPFCDNSYPLVLDGVTVVGTFDPTKPGCTTQRATRRATLEAEGMTAMFVLCDTCVDLLRKDARAYGIKFSSKAIEIGKILPSRGGDTPGENAPGEPQYSAEDVTAYEGYWDVYFETGGVPTVRKTVKRIDSIGILQIAFERADRGLNVSTLNDRRRIIQQRIRQLEKLDRAA